MDWGTNGLTHFMAPIAVGMWECHIKFSSFYIPRDFTEKTCSMGTLSMESLSVSDRVLDLCLGWININSVFVAFKVRKSVRHKPFA